MNKIFSENIKKFTDNILLSNTNIAPTDEKRYRLILTNMSFIVTMTVSFLFAIINTMQSSFLIVAIDVFMIFSSFLGIYYLRKGYDVNKLAIFMTILLFIGSLGIVIIRSGVEYTLVWSLLFPIAAIMLNGAKKGFYFSIVFIVINFIIVYSFIDSSITMSGYIRFISVSIIIIIIIYFYASTMKNVFDMLKKSMTIVDQFNKDLELKDYQQAQIIEQTHDSVISTDFNGIITGWNHGAKLMFGYTVDEATGQHISILYPKNELKSNEGWIDILRETGEYKTEAYRITKSGDSIFVLLSLTVIKDENGNPSKVVGFAQDITKRKWVEEELKEQKNVLAYQAHHDALTGLPNRILFNDRLEQAIEKAKRNDSKVALLFIDLDHFKEINDSLGHETGDKVLTEVTQRLGRSIRDEDTLARLGGDEFTIIVEDLTQGQDASLLAQKVLHVLAEPISIEENILYVSSSIGISLYPDDGGSSANLLKYADSAMYKAKDEGRNNFQFYSAEMTELAFERVVMETSLRNALEEEEFVVHYQAQVDGTTDKLIGMEALVRWQHPTMGLVSPAKFIPLAETTGLIIKLDNFVMKTAMTQVVKWYKDGLNPGVLAMNLAVKQLKQKDFIDVLKNLMLETGCKAEWIELEVTEGQIMRNPEEAIKILTQISNLGIKLAVDDFGTGYSSLAYLKRLPIDKLKIDQAFVQDLPDDEEDAGITKAVIALSNSLNLRVIAEGVETAEQRNFLIENGCNNIQGYFYSKPVPSDEFEVLLKNGFNI